jgi:AcrR family transcriptional regulator
VHPVELAAVGQVAVPVDQVGDSRAVVGGQGNATLYRHFPTRGDLLVAVYADEVAALCRRGADLLDDPSPVDALFAWLDAFVVHVATKRALALAATEGPGAGRTRMFDQWHGSMRSTATRLLRRAQDAGAVRPELTVADLLAIGSGAALSGTDVAHARRLVGLLRSGVELDTDGRPVQTSSDRSRR